MATLNAELDCALPTGIEKALCHAYESIKKLLDGRRLGLLIVILPDDRAYDEKVGDVCKKLGVTYHCCLPQDACILRQEYLDSAAREINAKAKEDCDSAELCDLDEVMGEYFDSSSDDEVSDSDSNELHGSNGFEQFDGWSERDIFSKETSESETFKVLDGSHKHSREDDGSKVTRLSSSKTEKEKDLASATDGSFELKAEMTSYIPASHVLDENSNYQTLKENEVQVEQGVVRYWACVSLSCLDNQFEFLAKLHTKLMSIGMLFRSLPSMISQVKSADRADIENTFLGVCNSISALQMEEHISLLLVILPEARYFDAKVLELCKNLGVAYHCCLPYKVRIQSNRYVKQTANQIKFEVLKRPVEIPFVSEAPTILLGADMSSCTGDGVSTVSVVGSMRWPQISPYLAASCHEGYYGGMVSNFLLHCLTATKQAPQRMIMFRYGITEERTQILREINSITQECHSSPIHKATLTYVIVTERLNMESEGRNEMTPNGTGVHDISCLTMFEVLCNHGPYEVPRKLVSYCVVHDENNLTPGALESIIVNLSVLRDHNRYPEISMGKSVHMT